jgi:DNA-binding NarL/FixJ family response regulator
VRVVIGEDQLLFREGLVRLLTESGFEVAGQTGNARDLVRKALAHRPDVVITDVRMPPGRRDDGVRAAIEIRQRLPRTAIMVLSLYTATTPAVELMTGGTNGIGYLLKDRVTDFDRFVDSVRHVAGGGSVLDPQVLARLLSERRAGPLDDLSPRELEVLGLVAEGRSNRGIAEQLVLTENAVEKHMRHILRKLDVPSGRCDHRRVLAAIAFLRVAETQGWQ